MTYFSQSIINKYSPANIRNLVSDVLYDTSRSYYIFYNTRHRPSEYVTIERQTLILMHYLLSNNKFQIPNIEQETKTIYRSSALNAVDGTNGWFPVAKNIADSCIGVQGHPNEATWFSTKKNNFYDVFINPHYPAFVKTCRNIRNISTDNKFNIFIKLTTDEVRCIEHTNPVRYSLDKKLQELINKVILVPIVRRYCVGFSNKFEALTNGEEDLTYEYIMRNKDRIFIDTAVSGYDCQDIYNPRKYPANSKKLLSLEFLLQAMDYITGARNSNFLIDRVHTQVMFDMFDIIETELNKQNNLLNMELIQDLGINSDTKINLLGWYASDTGLPDVVSYNTSMNCSAFPAECTISLRYFARPLRYTIFEPIDPTSECKPSFMIGKVECNELEALLVAVAVAIRYGRTVHPYFKTRIDLIRQGIGLTNELDILIEAQNEATRRGLNIPFIRERLLEIQGPVAQSSLPSTEPEAGPQVAINETSSGQRNCVGDCSIMGGNNKRRGKFVGGEYSESPKIFEMNKDIFEVFFDPESNESLYTKESSEISRNISNFLNKNNNKINTFKNTVSNFNKLDEFNKPTLNNLKLNLNNIGGYTKRKISFLKHKQKLFFFPTNF